VYVKLKQELASLKSKILESSSQIREEEGRVREYWRSYTPNPFQCTALATDGGKFVYETRSAVLYAVDAASYSCRTGKCSQVSSSSIVDVMRPGNKARKRVDTLMEILEIKLSLESYKGEEIVLMDGSVRSPFKNAESYATELRFLSARLIHELGSKVLWVSKNSRLSTLFGSELSDVTLLEILTKGVGYTIPVSKRFEVNDGLEDQIRDFLESKRYYVTYLRLEPGARVLRVETSEEPSTKDIERWIDCMSSVSVKGYPYPLLAVHRAVKIDKVDRERLLNALAVKRTRISSWWPRQLDS